MKFGKTIYVLTALLSLGAHARTKCTAICVVEDLKTDKILESHRVSRTSTSIEKAQKALEDACPYVLEGSLSEGGTLQHLNQTNCEEI